MNCSLRFIAFPLLAVVLVACQVGPQPSPVPSVNQIGSDLKCPSTDHAYADPAGWGFCYPADWKYNVRAQPSVDLRGFHELDVTFDITNVPTVNGSPLPSCPSPPPAPRTPAVCSSTAGMFAYMIISTYERGGSPNLASWIQDDLKPPPADVTPISWGNAVEAVRIAGGRRIAMTANQVVVLDLRAGAGNLDLEGEMSARLGTWKFYY